MKHKCCEEFEKSQEEGTDNEGHSSAIWDLAGKPQIGTTLQPINYCPWCGKIIKITP